MASKTTESRKRDYTRRIQWSGAEPFDARDVAIARVVRLLHQLNNLRYIEALADVIARRVEREAEDRPQLRLTSN